MRRLPLPTLFPYTTLFRSVLGEAGVRPGRPVGVAGEDLVVVDGAQEAHDPQLDHQRRSEEHTSELQSRGHLVCRLLLEKKKEQTGNNRYPKNEPRYDTNHI